MPHITHGLLSIGPIGTNFSETLIKMQNFSFMKMHLKISSAKWRPFCPGGDELRGYLSYWKPMVILKPLVFLMDCNGLQNGRATWNINFENKNDFLITTILTIRLFIVIITNITPKSVEECLILTMHSLHLIGIVYSVILLGYHQYQFTYRTNPPCVFSWLEFIYTWYPCWCNYLYLLLNSVTVSSW